ncbi:E1A/CREB-binding protein [Fistulifera solaris]|uniref:histone acetyltransferase n=1 Tax=Fistulifera solaris TaxID=1519565 RepID=A0A1Z5JQN1_FISSO|nr:E1A/CREB-binding protein [Fistulifera solaris]|eukprot:GAX16081.1 E1A/CREB-binding protein [Fistulifera solaris]
MQTHPQQPSSGGTSFPQPNTQQQPQQQQIFPHQGLNGGWQSDKDYEDRRKMIAKIVHLLQQRKPNAPQEWLKKLPQMAKRLEESLYRSAKSFNEYNDANTLKHRLQQLAVNIGMKTKKLQQQQALMQQQKMQQQAQQPGINQFSRSTMAGQMPQEQPLVKPQTQQPLQMPAQQVSNGQQRIVNMAEINPMMGSQTSAPSQPQAPVAAPAPPLQQIQYGQPGAAPAAPAPPAALSGAPNPNLSTANNGGRQIANRQQVLRHQQQRLLLLRHAAKCQYEDGRCPVTPHCAGMKRLWKHIAECKNQKCLVPHCVSSRYVLSHYHRCKDVRCPVCGPVREAIHRSHEKQKHMQALKQRHQQAVQQNQTQDGTQQQPLAPVPAGAVSAQPPQPLSNEPPNKKQRTAGVLTAPSFQVQQRPLQHPSARPGVPVQTQSGYSLSQQPGLQQTDPQLAHQQALQQQSSRPVVAATPGLAFSNGQVITPKYSGPKPQEDHTLINCFSVEQIECHIESLNNGLQLPPVKLKAKCLDVLRLLQSHQHAWVFNTPVDPVELGLPDYFEVIKKPMDLGTIRKKLENGVYQKIEEFEEHVLLTFDNAMLYNPEGSVVYNMAKEMREKFVRDYAKLIEVLNEEEDVKRKNGEACLLCGCEKLLFEPPVFYCNGMNCPSKRIRRNSHYYVAGNNQYHWCHQCYQELRDNSTIDLGDIQVKKESLTKKKNDEVHEESWVQCDRCERWVHQICALFNTRQNKDQRSEYACPRCTIEERKKRGNLEATSSSPMAEDLPRTKMSQYLESHVRQKVDEFVEKKSKAVSIAENIPFEEAKKKIQMGGAITIRQVTSMDRKLEVRERMKRRYAFKNYPEEFTFRCKCFIVFQNLDGVDVVLFGLYVYEHDEKNPPPNNRTVYVSYLDSVHYMRPRQMRTFIYHEILISYLDYVRRRGFATAHIWACPPLKGDDYILYAKPEDQKTPRDDRLKQWYIDMLVESQRRGIVGKVTNMYDLYFSNPKNDATVVPYMDGDYFPAEAENIIKDIEEGKTGKKSSFQGKKKEKAKQKKKSGRGGTRSTGLDEEALKASGILPSGADQKSLEEGGRDYVMVKLGETIQPMKESFIVAYLAWSGAKEEDMQVPKEIEEYRKEHGVTWKINEGESTETATKDNPKTADSSEMDTNEKLNSSESSITENPTSTDKAATETTEQQPVKLEEEKDTTTHMDTDANGVEAKNDKGDESLEVNKSSDKPDSDPTAGELNGDVQSAPQVDMKAEESASVPATASQPNAVNLSIREGKFAAMAARKRDLEGVPKEESSKEDDPAKTKSDATKTITVKDSKGRTVKVLDDDEEELDCEFLNNRQAFLNLCQGNHYQFDTIRRAKHSSMMVLWHLHNRDAPKFVQQCATCSREILTGVRYHCPTCADFDQCHECVSNSKMPRHPHPLKPIAVGNGQQSDLTEEQRKERQRSIQLHMTLLQHAATCSNAKCPSANCTKMKGLLKHGSQCQIKATGGCNVCKRIWALLQIHARQCKTVNCAVPNCMAIRERFRQLKKQQMAMDDRRRQEMNRACRGKRA